VLSLSGRDCKPAKNPFNADKPTLLVKVVDGCATHTDSEEAIGPGNAFDFAALHFSLGGQALLDNLNEELHLRITPQHFQPKGSQKVQGSKFRLCDLLRHFLKEK